MKKSNSESSRSTEEKLNSEIFSENSNNNDSGSFLLQLLKLMLTYSTIFITLEMVNKYVTAFSKKIVALNCSANLISSKVVFYYYKSTIRLCVEFYFHVPNGAFTYHLHLLDRLPNEYLGLLVIYLLLLLNC